MNLCLPLFLTLALSTVEVRRGYCFDTAAQVGRILHDEKSEMLFIKPRYRRTLPDGSHWHVVLKSAGIVYDLDHGDRYYVADNYFDEVFGEPVLVRRVPFRDIESGETDWVAQIFDEGPWEAR